MISKIIRIIYGLTVVVMIATAVTPSAAIAQDKSKRQIRLEGILSQWVGRTADDLYLAFGSPIDVVEMPSGGRLYSFSAKDEIGGGSSGGGEGEESANKALFGKKAGKILDAFDDGEPIINECVVNFAVDGSGIVTAARIQKNDKVLFLDTCSKVIQAP